MITDFKKIENRIKYNDFVMPFGKYAGCFLMDIKSEDPNYFEWLKTLDQEEGHEEFFKALEHISQED